MSQSTQTSVQLPSGSDRLASVLRKKKEIRNSSDLLFCSVDFGEASDDAAFDSAFVFTAKNFEETVITPILIP